MASKKMDTNLQNWSAMKGTSFLWGIMLVKYGKVSLGVSFQPKCVLIQC